MNTKLFLLIVCATLALVSADYYNHEFHNHNTTDFIQRSPMNAPKNAPRAKDPKQAFSEYWSQIKKMVKGGKQGKVYVTSSPYKPANTTSRWNYMRKDVSQQSKNFRNPRKCKLSRKSLWRVFDYMNKKHLSAAQDSRCKNTTQTGCCMKGKFYEEEKCWLTILSIATVGTVFIVFSLCCMIALCLVFCCICAKKCQRKKMLEALKKRNASVATVATVATQPQAPVLQRQTQTNNTVKVAPKCNCPKKHESLKNLNTTQTDFSYQPPRLTQNLLPKTRPQTQSVEMNNNPYPKFEEVEVKNPYPQFEYIQKSNFII